MRKGQVGEATNLMGRAAVVRPRLNAAFPFRALEALLDMTRALIELADVARGTPRDAGSLRTS